MKKIDKEVIEGFGDEWTRFDQVAVSEMELKEIFENYFSIFPWNSLPKKATGFDLGCGTGRWANFVASKVHQLYCIDPSSAIHVARRNLTNHSNIKYENNDVFDMEIPHESMDFGYTLGVLHHITDTEEGLRECVLRLKKGAPLLIYLYYALDNRSLIFRLIWKITNIFRLIISRLPMPFRYIISQFIAFFIYFPIARFSFLLSKIGFETNQIPLSMYKDKSFYTMRTDSLDRFGTKTEKRFTRKEIEKMMIKTGLKDIKFREDQPFWCAVGSRDF